MNGHQKIAARNIKGAFNYQIGGLYNSYLDGEEINFTIEEAKEMVYDCAINDTYFGGGVIYNQPVTAMRFAGKQFCLDYIDKLFAKDEDVVEIPWQEV